MEHSARLNSNRIIAIVILFISISFFLSLSINIIQAVNNYRLQNEQKVAVTPMMFNKPFAISLNSADASYMQQMALSFIALRLNVTPETVDAAHAILLTMVKPASQNNFKIQLLNDAKRIKHNEVNSTFYQTSIRVYPADKRIDVKGVLKTWIGNSKPMEEQKHYVIILDLSEGVTWLAKFLELKDEKK